MSGSGISTRGSVLVCKSDHHSAKMVKKAITTTAHTALVDLNREKLTCRRLAHRGRGEPLGVSKVLPDESLLHLCLWVEIQVEALSLSARDLGTSSIMPHGTRRLFDAGAGCNFVAVSGTCSEGHAAIGQRLPGWSITQSCYSATVKTT